MQTFLPYETFEKSAHCLDGMRLRNQRRETLSLITSLQIRSGWIHHPAAKMWDGYLGALCQYGIVICDEVIRRGWKDQSRALFEIELILHKDYDVNRLPPWLGNEKLHSSHRSNLLRKDKSWYGYFGWTEPDNLPYFWPTNDNQNFTQERQNRLH